MKTKTIIGDGYYLSPLAIEDCQKMSEYLNNENIYKTTANLPFPYTYENAIAFVNHCNHEETIKRFKAYGIHDLISDDLVGSISIGYDATNHNGEVGYWIAEPFWNQGIASKALNLLLKHVFINEVYEKVYAYYYTNNIASGRVMEKCGMSKVGLLRHDIYKDGVYIDCYMCEILKDDFLRNNDI